MNPAKDQFLALGLMSGTSMDGIDCALVDSNGQWVKPVGKPVHIPYSSALKARISSAMKRAALFQQPQRHNDQINRLERDLTILHGNAVARILRQNDLGAQDIDVIGFHGQTLRHQPDKGWSWQIGDGQLLADITRIAVVNDFRRRDVENGGQGAPLVPVYHLALSRSANLDYPVAVINIGGIANITWIGSDREDQLLAFDCGPGNGLLDDWMRQHTGEPMDRDGKLAAKGRIDYPLVERWLENSYFVKVPPKSLDRHCFDLMGLDKLSGQDGAATLTHFTVKSIEAAIRHCPVRPQYIYICGGGRHNKTLMSGLVKLDIPVDSVEKLGWRGDFLEAEAFAYLACRHLSALPITFPGTTGIRNPSQGGELSRP